VRSESLQPHTERSSRPGPELPSVEADVYVWRYALLVVQARKKKKKKNLTWTNYSLCCYPGDIHCQFCEPSRQKMVLFAPPPSRMLSEHSGTQCTIINHAELTADRTWQHQHSEIQQDTHATQPSQNSPTVCANNAFASSDWKRCLSKMSIHATRMLHISHISDISIQWQSYRQFWARVGLGAVSKWVNVYVSELTNLWGIEIRIRSLGFQAGCHKRRLNLALVFLCFVLQYISFDWWMYAFVMLGLVFPYQAKRLAWGTSPKWPI